MGNRWNFEPDWKSRKEFVDEIDDPKSDEDCRPKFTHEVRRVKQVQHPENAKSDQEIRRKNAGDVYTANLEDFRSRHLYAEEKCYSNEKDGERAWMNAVEKR